MLTKEECLDALNNLRANSELVSCCTMNRVKVLKQLINEHFDNSPLKFEELKEGMWVWDNNFKSYYTRTWEENGRLKYDVGSHTEFFFLED